MLVDLSREEKDILESVRSSEYYKNKGFISNYYDLKFLISSLVTSAKVYILDNYDKIEDWSELSLSLYHNKSTKGPTLFGLKDAEDKKRYPSRKSGKRSGTMQRLLKKIDDETTQIEKIESCVYDWTDGDFSLDINGVKYLWIDGESAIKIADYISKKINKK